ncbi:hypothetical protein F5Y14DRAFT_425582 [Nemania sp. NC0429]|nr:hypothetical protein F5Y14DRAFT_425582 [Nemania sp. NC0429]
MPAYTTQRRSGKGGSPGQSYRRTRFYISFVLFLSYNIPSNLALFPITTDGAGLGAGEDYLSQPFCKRLPILAQNPMHMPPTFRLPISFAGLLMQVWLRLRIPCRKASRNQR